MTHQELHTALETLGWTKDIRDTGAVFFYSNGEIVDRAIQTVPQDPDHALAMVRGGEQSCTSVEEALAWARG